MCMFSVIHLQLCSTRYHNDKCSTKSHMLKLLIFYEVYGLDYYDIKNQNVYTQYVLD